jgi:hypothetical protein
LYGTAALSTEEVGSTGVGESERELAWGIIRKEKGLTQSCPSVAASIPPASV